MRPYVFLCTGMSLDGKIATAKRVQSEIAPYDDRDLLYECRCRADAIMVGATTLRDDDPRLHVKSKERQQQRIQSGKSREPIKVAVVSDISDIIPEGDFFREGRRIIFTTKRSGEGQIRELSQHAQLWVCGESRVDLKEALHILHEQGIKTLMVEGGGELIFSLLKEDLVDEINLKIGNLILGGRDAPTLCDGDGFITGKQVTLINLTQKENYLILHYRLTSQNG
ncbi:MAG: dihydrofolate reductase family protein [Nanobdellota archaeon]